MPLKPIITTAGPLEYTASSRFTYRFSRFLVLPRITKCEEFKSGQPFYLAPMILAITDEYLTSEEQQAIYLRKNGIPERVLDAIRWYVTYLGRMSTTIERVAPGGWYRMPTGVTTEGVSKDEIAEDVTEEVGETGSQTDGWIYAFTFPELIKNEPFPIKVGMAISSVEERVGEQCEGATIFSSPIILKSWQVKKMTLTARTLQNLLKISGRCESEDPGTGWFVTTLAEVERLLGIVQMETR